MRRQQCDRLHRVRACTRTALEFASTVSSRDALAFVGSGLVAGTGCIICSKTLFELKAVGISGEEEVFHPQVFQPFVMFFGMLFALPLYLGLEAWKRVRARTDATVRAELDAAPQITLRHLLLLGVPSVFDLASVVLLVSGLMHVPASMWMLLRGGCIGAPRPSPEPRAPRLTPHFSPAP